MEEAFDQSDKEVYTIGDAQSGSGSIITCIWSAFEVASRI
jgi:hypothetical protein